MTELEELRELVKNLQRRIEVLERRGARLGPRPDDLSPYDLDALARLIKSKRK